MQVSKVLVTIFALSAATLTLSAADGKELYTKHCAKCHGADGVGTTPMGKKTGAKDFTDAAVQAKFTDAQFASAIKDGFKEGDKVKMKGYDELSTEEVNALVAYVRAFKK